MHAFEHRQLHQLSVNTPWIIFLAIARTQFRLAISIIAPHVLLYLLSSLGQMEVSATVTNINKQISTVAPDYLLNTDIFDTYLVCSWGCKQLYLLLQQYFIIVQVVTITMASANFAALVQSELQANVTALFLFCEFRKPLIIPSKKLISVTFIQD